MSTPPPQPKVTPTTGELNGAIEEILVKGRKDWRDVHASLKKEHPEWKLPERRVAKFVKRQKAGNPVGADDDSVTPSIGPVRRFMKNRSERKAAKSSATSAGGSITESKEEEKADEVAPAESEKKTESQLPPMEKEPEEEPQLLPTPEKEEVKKTVVFEEDTKEKKEGALCEGCIIL